MPSEATISKPVLPPLQTPKSASFPSEIVSTPMSAHHPGPLSALIKQEQDLKTPITPPTAYTDFLKALTPILASPPPSGLSRSLSDESVTSTKDGLLSSHSSKSSLSPASARLFSPTSAPHSAPLSGNGKGTPTHLKRLRIPQYSPIFSPASSNPGNHSAMPSAMYSPFSPADWTGRSNFDYLATPRSAVAKPVSVRSVVTRTVTYKRSVPTTPIMEPAPKGKRRKMASTTPSVASEDDAKGKLMSIRESQNEGQGEIKRTHVRATSTASVTMPPPAAPTPLSAPPMINISPASSDDNDNDSSSSLSSGSASETDGGDTSSSVSGSDNNAASP